MLRYRRREVTVVKCSWLLGAILLAHPTVLSAQIEIPFTGPHCAGLKHDQPSKQLSSSLVPQPRAFSIGQEGLCAEYAYSGWEDSMRLYLGEGAREYLPFVRMAVKLWNDALEGFNQRQTIELIKDRTPRPYNLQSGFWSSDELHSRTNVQDGVSVIYFNDSGKGEDDVIYSFARVRWDTYDRMAEADVYIDTNHHARYGKNLAYTEPVLSGESASSFAFVDSIYVDIIHELGHALGLKHVPISGNIMSYNYMPKLSDVWKTPMMLFEFQQTLSTGIEREGLLEYLPWLQRNDEVYPYMVVDPGSEILGLLDLFNNSVVLGEQDRMALMCVYSFDNWSHR